MKRSLFFLLSIFAAACGNHDRPATSTHADTASGARSSVSASAAKAVRDTVPKGAPVSLARDIRGFWTVSDTENTAFVIEEKTIYYPDPMVRRKYRIRNDSLMVSDDGGYLSWAARMRGLDTLVLTDPQGKAETYHRVKE